MAEHFLYLTTTGRRTGLPREIEIWFVEHDGCYYMVSEGRDRAHWVQNIQKSAEVTFSIGPRSDRAAGLARTTAVGRVVLPDDEPDLARAVCARMDEKYRWSDGLIVELAPAKR